MFTKEYLHSIFAPFASPLKKQTYSSSERFKWECGGFYCHANTKSEARSKFKKMIHGVMGRKVVHLQGVVKKCL